MTGPSSVSSTNQSAARMVAMSLVAGGLVTIVVAIVLGATVEPFLYAIALVAIIDFALAWAFATGRIGTGAQRTEAAQPSGASKPDDAASIAAQDPSYNPYARED